MNPDAASKEPLPMHPTVFTVFGITGDLASRKLLPALLGLYARRQLPPRFAIVGFSRRSLSREEFREQIRERLNVRPGEYREEDIKHFLDHISYEQGMFNDPAAYARLADRLRSIDERWGQCSNKLFHLSVPPVLYEGILTNLSTSKLTVPCDDNTGWTRVLIEKPFGNDIETARSLDKLLGRLFDEKQIFRIDHYLAKEALQNILAFRFSNSMFEPIWKRDFIEKVHIKLFEKGTVDGRGAFYDPIGALKDVGQNHLLQMLALVAMERPANFSAAAIRRERARVMGKLKGVPRRLLPRMAVKGQYKGYILEPGVATQSKTETYIRLETHLAAPRWKGVPFYLESGKAMYDSKTEIDVYFKPTKGNPHQNILTFRIQPDEGIKIRLFVKTPGYEYKVEPKPLKFTYADLAAYGTRPDDYERLIRDAFVGDQTLFASTEEIMASWKFVTALLDGWEKLPLKIYEVGSREI